jgi:hypothetical protein
MLRVAFALLFGLAAATAQPSPQAPSQPMMEPATQLASRISSLLPRHPTVSIEQQNLSTLPESEWSNFRTLFEAELRKAGIEVSSSSSAEPRVRITVSDNARGLLFVAEVVAPDNRQIAMLPWSNPAAGEEEPRVNLTKKLLWTQPEPILDVLLPDPNTMLVLSPSKVASFRFVRGNWTTNATSSLVLPRPIPRDPRGRIESTSGGFCAYLPGTTCTGAWQPDLKITCAPGNETWSDAQVRWITDRNLLESDAVKGPFYSTANGVFVMAEGHTTTTEGWGTDIASLQNTCGTGVIAALIATSTETDRDSVQAYQSTEPISDALPLPGPVTALWPSETPGEVTLVVHNLQTGNYEASRLGLACSQ